MNGNRRTAGLASLYIISYTYSGYNNEMAAPVTAYRRGHAPIDHYETALTPTSYQYHQAVL
jgi:hypothetical protein